MTGTEPAERLQAATKELIRAARMMLDAAEELVDDPARARDAATGAGEFVTDFVDALSTLAARGASGVRERGRAVVDDACTGARTADRADGRDGNPAATPNGTDSTDSTDNGRTPGERLRRLQVVDADSIDL